MSRNIFFAFVAVILTVASFTGCKNDLEKHVDETASADGASSDEMTVILPGDVVLTMVKVETNPEDDSFHPWKEYDSLDDFLMQSIQD